MRPHLRSAAWALVGWLAAGVLFGSWLWVGQQPMELVLAGSWTPPLALRLDALTVAMGEAILLPASLLLTFQSRSSGEQAIALLALAFAELAVAADSLLLLAAALGGCAALLALRTTASGQNNFSWKSALGAAILLMLAAALLQTLSHGAALLSSVPVTAFTAPVFLLILIAALLCGRWLPGMSYLGWNRGREVLAEILLLPLGFMLLARAYSLGGGSWPGWWLNDLGIILGIFLALAGGIGIQRAATARHQLEEAVRVSSGLALIAFSLGTPLGVAAGLFGVFAASWGSAVSRLCPLGGRLGLIGLPLALGAPPGLAFGAMLLTLMAALEIGGSMRFLVVVIGVIWLISWSGVVRGVSRSVDPYGTEESRAGGYASLLGLLLGGAGGGVLAQLVINPAAAQLIGSNNPPISGSLTVVESWPGGFGALGISLALLLALLGLASLTTPIRSASELDLSDPISSVSPLPPRSNIISSLCG
ncbi:MAG: hypothetical protein ACREN8_10315, partial [Candidatus Dormibacteraceae bacterium]